MPTKTATCQKCGKAFTYMHARGPERVNCDDCKQVRKKREPPSLSSLERRASGVGIPVSHALEMLSDAATLMARHGWKIGSITILPMGGDVE